MVIALLVVVTAMCAVGSASKVDLDKHVVSVDPEPVGGCTINYMMTVNNNDPLHTWYELEVKDIYPDGSEEIMDANLHLNYGDSKDYYRSYTVPDDWPGGDVINTLAIDGENSGGEHASGKTEAWQWVDPKPTPTPTPTYSTPPTDVPAQSPIAIVALIGLLGLIGAGMIIGRK